jgi:TetR/AcrR family transcriptional regulator, repressor for uid operon
MPRTRDIQLHDQRRQDILAAAARVFKAKGFHLARTSDICDEAGLSAGTVFRHFATKREMILAIAQMEFETYQSVVAQLASRDGLEALGRIDSAGLADLLRPTVFALGADSWLELTRDPDGHARMLAFDRELRETLTEMLRKGQSAGWVQPGINPAGAANLLMALVSGLNYDVEIGAEVDLRDTAQALADFVTRNLLRSE